MESPPSGSFFQRTLSFCHKLFAKTHNWKESTTNCPKRDSAAKCVTKDMKDSIAEHGDFHCKKQNCNANMGVQDMMLSNKTITITPLNLEISQEHIIEAGNEVLCERSLVTTPGFPSPEMSSIVSNTVDSSTGSKRRRIIEKTEISKLGCSLVNDISSLDKGTPNDSSSSETLRNLVVSKVSGGCKKGSSKTASCSNDRKGDLTDNIFIMRTDMKGYRNKKKRRVNVPQKEGIDFKSKMPVKRKLITSPRSVRFTSSTGSKGSAEPYESANIISLESFSEKKSRSGRIVLPPLEFWRNQKVVYDEDGQMCGVQVPK